MNDRLPSQVAADFIRSAENVAEALQRDTRERQKEELGFELEDKVAEISEGLRGKYDVSRLHLKHPQLVNLITWLLSLPGMTYQAIAEACGKGVCWETVAAIAATRQKPIREFKLRAAGMLQLVLEAAGPGLMQRAAEGKLSALDYKLLTDAYLQLSGEGHTVRFEGTQNEDPRRTRLRQMISEGGDRGMVFEAEVIPQKAATPAELAPPPDATQLNTLK